MAHEINIAENGQASFGFVGDRNKIWHGLGQQLNENSSIEEWVVQAGFDWDVIETPVLFRDSTGNIQSSEEKKVLYRSDTMQELSVVGSKYKVLQPKETLEFFRDIVDGTGIYLDTAGILFGGRRFFANANTSKMDYVGKKEDTISCNLLLSTSVDGTLASSAAFTSVRTVCANTLAVALEDTKNSRVKVSHRTVFDANKVKAQLGLIDNAWGLFIENLNRLAAKKVSDSVAMDIYQTLVYKDKAKPTPQEVTKANLFMDLYKNGVGAEMTYGNLYGVLQGCTEAVDHHSRNRTEDAKFISKFYGAGNDLKLEAFDLLLEMA